MEIYLFIFSSCFGKSKSFLVFGGDPRKMIVYTKHYVPYSFYMMFFHLSFNHCIVVSTSEAYFHIDGDVLFGALLSIGKNKTGQSCKSFNEDSLVLVDSIHYAVSVINSRPDLLRNVSLGIEIHDTSFENRSPAQQALAFVRRSKLQRRDSASEENKPIVAVITDFLDKQVFTLLEMFHIPYISLTKHSVVNFTKDTVGFGSFGSVSFYKALALIDLIKTFKSWRSVSVVYSNELLEEFKIFEALAEKSSICLSLTSDLRKATATVTINKLLTEFSSSVVLLLTVAVETAQLFAAVKSHPRFNEQSRLTWLIAGDWSEKIEDVEDVVDGALIVDPVFPFVEEMNNFYRHHASMSKTFSMSNIDFSLRYPYKDKNNKRKLYPFSRFCDSPEYGPGRVAKLQAVVNSILLFAKALDSLFKESCTSGSFVSCKSYFHSLNKENLIDKLQHFYNINYRFSTSLYFDGKDLKENIFALFNYRKNFELKLKMVGTWERSWFINTKEIHWQNGSKSIPESSCSYPCTASHVRVPRNDRKCCWTCSPCNDNQILKNDSFCEDCRRGFWPSKDLKTCEFKLLDVVLKGLLYFLSIVVVFYISVL